MNGDAGEIPRVLTKVDLAHFYEAMGAGYNIQRHAWAADLTAAPTRETADTFLAHKLARVGSSKAACYPNVQDIMDKAGHDQVMLEIVDRDAAPRNLLAKQLPNRLASLQALQGNKHIVQCYEQFDSPWVKLAHDKHRYRYSALEHVRGGRTLTELVGTRGLPEHQAWKLADQLCDALQFCHARRVAHCHLTPDSILVDEHDCLKLTDFTYSKRMWRKKRKSHLVKHACAAPEVLKGKKCDPFAADMWSLGCILYFMTHGHLPFKLDKPGKDDYQKLIPKDMTSLTFKDDLSQEFKDLVRLLLTYKSKHRLNDWARVINHKWMQVAPVSCPTDINNNSNNDSVPELPNWIFLF